jgi:hypothetical protein
MTTDPPHKYHVISKSQRILLDALCQRVLATTAEFPIAVVVEHWPMPDGTHTYQPCFQYRVGDWLIDIMHGSVSIYREPAGEAEPGRLRDILRTIWGDGSVLVDEQDYKTQAAYVAKAIEEIDKTLASQAT